MHPQLSKILIKLIVLVRREGGRKRGGEKYWGGEEGTIPIMEIILVMNGSYLENYL